MKIGILIPYRGLHSNKSRLRLQLNAEIVEELLFLMTQHVISTALKIKESRTYLITKQTTANFKGKYTLIKDKGNELNETMEKAIQNINERIILILMADLPLISKEVIEKTLKLCEDDKSIIIAPSPDKGTSMLCFSKEVEFPFFFGELSSLKFVDYFKKNNIKYKLLDFERPFSDIDTLKDLLKIQQMENFPKWLKHIFNGINNEGENKENSKCTQRA
ncbi:MAG: 2-phospho-L-lactate guanylyltransferase [Candidatus Heimdallarchaeaceae archaeon]